MEQSAAQLVDTERQILAEVVKAHADAVSALGNLESSRTLLDAASDSLASSERRYVKGAADILELLNQQSLFAEARQERALRAGMALGEVPFDGGGRGDGALKIVPSANRVT